MSKKETRTSIHHLVPRSREGTNEPENLTRIKETTHRAIHTLFENKLIAEQLITTVNLSQQAMRPEVVQRLIETLTAHDPRDLDFRYKDNTHF